MAREMLRRCLKLFRESEAVLRAQKMRHKSNRRWRDGSSRNAHWLLPGVDRADCEVAQSRDLERGRRDGSFRWLAGHCQEAKRHDTDARCSGCHHICRANAQRRAGQVRRIIETIWLRTAQLRAALRSIEDAAQSLRCAPANSRAVALKQNHNRTSVDRQILKRIQGVRAKRSMAASLVRAVQFQTI